MISLDVAFKTYCISVPVLGVFVDDVPNRIFHLYQVGSYLARASSWVHLLNSPTTLAFYLATSHYEDTDFPPSRYGYKANTMALRSAPKDTVTINYIACGLDDMTFYLR